MTDKTNDHPTFTEAPASINFRFSYRGADVQLTLRDASGSALLDKLDAVLNRLEKMGAALSQGRPAQNGAAPLCPDGHGPMKESNKQAGTYYCSAVVGTHPQTGKKLYCTHKA